MSALTAEDRKRLEQLAFNEEHRAVQALSDSWTEEHEANATLLHRLAEQGTGEKPAESERPPARGGYQPRAGSARPVTPKNPPRPVFKGKPECEQPRMAYNDYTLGDWPGWPE